MDDCYLCTHITVVVDWYLYTHVIVAEVWYETKAIWITDPQDPKQPITPLEVCRTKQNTSHHKAENYLCSVLNKRNTDYNTAGKTNRYLITNNR